MDEFYIYSSSLFALKNVIAFIIIGIVPFAVRYRGLIDCFAAAVIAAAVLIMIGIMNFVTICKLSGYRKTTRKTLKEAKSLPQRKGTIGETKSKLKKCAVNGDYENFNAILEEIHNEYKEIKEKQNADFLAKKEEILAKFG